MTPIRIPGVIKSDTVNPVPVDIVASASKSYRILTPEYGLGSLQNRIIGAELQSGVQTEHGRIIVNETCIDAKVEKGYLCMVETLIAEARSQIEDKIDSDPFFEVTYEPYTPSANDERIVRWMCDASSAADVGPMAAVAGAIDRYVLEALTSAGCGHIILDNDGDTAMLCDDPVVVILYSGDEDMPALSSTLEPRGEMLSVCTSSGRIGHSISFGSSSMASVISRDPALADACATRLGNLCRGDPGHATELVCSIDGVIGCFAVDDGHVALCGDFPIDEL